MTKQLKISRRSDVEPFHAMDTLALANRLRDQGRSIVSLAVGQPSARPPLAVREAAALALRDGTLGYTDATGRADLRAAIASHYGLHYGLDIDPERIVVTTGSSAGFALSFLSLFDPGDRVLIERPGYPAYRNIMRALSLEVVEVEHLDAQKVGRAHDDQPVAGILVASPANPTGTVLSPGRMLALREAARERGIRFISDEIYHRLTYDGVADRTALVDGDDVVVINSFSKYYCMTGWRIGWMVVPHYLTRTIERIAQSLYISAPEVSQIGACHAFEPTEELESVRRGYARNRDMLRAALPELGFRLAAPPDGAFYAWCDVSGLTNNAGAFSRRMVEEIGVAAPAGHDFDPERGDTTMRMSYAGGHDEIAEAVRRLRAWV